MKKVIITLLALVSLQNVISQCPQIDKCIEEISETNSDKLLKYFEENKGNAFDAWKVLYLADKNIDRVNTSNLKELSGYIVSSKKEPSTIIKEINDAGGYKKWRLSYDQEYSVTSLTQLVNKKSSIDIPWKNLDDKTLIWVLPQKEMFYTAKFFANQKVEKNSSFYDLVLNGDKYVKVDIENGMILVGNTDGTYQTFAVIQDAVLGDFKTSLVNVSNEVFKTKMKDFISENVKKLDVLTGKRTKPIMILNKNVSLNSNKVNTFLGRFDPNIKQLFDELGSFKNIGLGETKGGINILNKPDHYYEKSSWWTVYNMPWLNSAIKRRDDIYLATIPKKVEDFFDYEGDIRSFASELKLLVDNNYRPKNITDEEWESIKVLLIDANI